MKKFITFMVTVLCLTVSMSAQDSFYYYRGSKVPLKEDATKIVSISPISENTPLTPSKGFTLVNTISDSRSLIRVYELASSTTIKNAISANASKNVSIQQCYKSENGNELIPNGYLNVQMKSADDYPKLQTIAAENGCDIIEQNQFMHLGYNLKIKELLEHAIDSAVTRGRECKGCVFVKSAGNTYGAISYPGDYSQDVLAVANMTIDGTLARSSGHGPNLL